MSLPFTPALAREYQELWDSCVVKPTKAQGIDDRARLLLENRDRYKAVAQTAGCPWQVVAVIHSMEADCNFKRHLHNGDPLTARTVQEPPGRPVHGNPPFTWEASADDALRYDGIAAWKQWSLPGILYRLECFNGLGSRNHGIHTPYLWSGSNHYTSGKYVADHKWDPDAVSQQVGAALLLKRLHELGEFQPQPAPAAKPLPPQFAHVRYDPGHYSADAEALQRWLGDHAGVAVGADGRAGKNTSDAVMQVTGSYLPGDPRA